MSFFQNVLTNPAQVEQQLLGPSYSYSSNINTPQQLGMSDAGDLQTLGRDVNGLLSYVELLVSGNGRASRTGGPLGNKFFMKTGARCKDTTTGKKVDRYIYFNNIPTGNLGPLTGGAQFNGMRGLIPGTIGSLGVLNPFGIMRSFMSGDTPPCQQVTLQTVDVNNNSSSESHFVTLADIESMDAYNFPNGQKPSLIYPKEGFSLYDSKDKSVSLPDDPVVQLYFICLSLVGVYMLYRMMEKEKR
jgi:hypothetical protein